MRFVGAAPLQYILPIKEHKNGTRTSADFAERSKGEEMKYQRGEIEANGCYDIERHFDNTGS
jgi:hypothetical protein